MFSTTLGHDATAAAPLKISISASLNEPDSVGSMDENTISQPLSGSGPGSGAHFRTSSGGVYPVSRLRSIGRGGLAHRHSAVWTESEAKRARVRYSPSSASIRIHLHELGRQCEEVGRAPPKSDARP